MTETTACFGSWTMNTSWNTITKILRRIQKKTRICFSFRILISRNRASAATRRRFVGSRYTKNAFTAGPGPRWRELLPQARPPARFTIRGSLCGEGKESRIREKLREDRIIIIIIIIINKVLIKVTLNKVIAGALYIVICGWKAVKVLGWQLTVEWRLKQRCL